VQLIRNGELGKNVETRYAALTFKGLRKKSEEHAEVTVKGKTRGANKGDTSGVYRGRTEKEERVAKQQKENYREKWRRNMQHNNKFP